MTSTLRVRTLSSGDTWKHRPPRKGVTVHESFPVGTADWYLWRSYRLARFAVKWSNEHPRTLKRAHRVLLALAERVRKDKHAWTLIVEDASHLRHLALNGRYPRDTMNGWL